MSINIIGLNHKTAPLDIREKLVFDKQAVQSALKEIKRINGVNEVVVLSTCNRTEIYTESDDNNKIINWFNDTQKVVDNCLPFTYSYSDEQAINHLFHVTSGMDSMVIGETEILGQVKDAYKLANVNKAVNSSLKRLFEFSFSVAKQVRTDTDIGSNPITFMFTAITLIKKIFDEIKQKKALLIGTGDMSRLAIKYLQSNNLTDITITNRNTERGKKLADENNCKYLKLQDLPKAIIDNDIIISSTSSSLPIIGKGMMESCLKSRSNKPVIIIDLGVPRDVESEISQLDNIYLYTIDDLGKVIENNYKIRQQAMLQAEKIINLRIIEFKNWLTQNKSNTLIKSYRDYVDDITDGVLIKAKIMAKKDNNINDVLIYLAESLKNKLTHETTSKLKELTSLLDDTSNARIKDIFKDKE